ncbi:MAG: hypothetical protein E7213_04360 [Clostridium sp.]|nr:hypothetical protein [Clostridium sp.]
MSENIDKYDIIKINSLLNVSISSIINFFIKDDDRRAVDVNILNNFFSLRIYGDFDEKREFDSAVLKALLNLCQEVYYVTVKDKMKTVKIIDFSTYKNGVYNEKYVSTTAVDDKTDNVGFIIYKKNYKPLLKNLMNEQSKESLKKYLNDAYSNALSYLKLRVFNEVVDKSFQDGRLLDEKIINDNIKIQLYRMKKKCKSLDIAINGIKLKDKIDSRIINWNQYPYRQKGYAFRKMKILICIDENKIDLNDDNFIKNIVNLCEGEIEELIEKNKENFRNGKTYINIDYDKRKMNYILKKTGCKSPVEAIKRILDSYCSKE